MHRNEKEIEGLARAILPILRNQVVVRYGASRDAGDFEFEAQAAVISSFAGGEKLAQISLSVDVRRQVNIRSGFKTITPTASLVGVQTMLGGWNSRPFDDWLHATPFMGAIGFYRDGQPHTSVKVDRNRDPWHFLTGVLAGAISGLSSSITAGCSHDQIMAIHLLQKRFSAFAAQNIHRFLADCIST